MQVRVQSLSATHRKPRSLDDESAYSSTARPVLASRQAPSASSSATYPAPWPPIPVRPRRGRGAAGCPRPANKSGCKMPRCARVGEGGIGAATPVTGRSWLRPGRAWADMQAADNGRRRWRCPQADAADIDRWHGLSESVLDCPQISYWHQPVLDGSDVGARATHRPREELKDWSLRGLGDGARP
jgi:hypothetical protein